MIGEGQGKGLTIDPSYLKSYLLPTLQSEIPNSLLLDKTDKLTYIR